MKDKHAADHDESEESVDHSEPEDHHESDGRPVKGNPFQKLWQWALGHKKISIPVAVVLLLAILGAIPVTRYAIASTFWKQDFPVVVVDSETNKPVSRAQVTLRGSSAFTDSQGKATLHVPVGSTTLNVDKRYYKTVSQDVTVTISKPVQPLNIKFQATGRQVPVTVTNKITHKAVKGAVVKADGAEVQTDDKGQAILVVSASKTEAEATVTAKDYNKSSVKIKVTTAVDPANSFLITPVGKVYFLSNKTGKIDVVKTDLDGSNRQLVLGGTGNEDQQGTSLIASQDWKYLALYSKRDGGTNAKLFLIDTTASDQIITMDEGNATFGSLGWSGHNFVYSVDRTQAVQSWQNKQYGLKSYDAEAKKNITLDDSTASGTSPYDYLGELFTSSYILGSGQIVYGKTWRSANTYLVQGLPGKQDTLNTVNGDGSNHKVVQSFAPAPGYFAPNTYLLIQPYEPNALRIQFANGQANTYYTYENGAATIDKSINDDNFYRQAYFTYSFSPDSKQTFWAESRDGKATLFVGNEDGEQGKEIMSNSNFSTYGWFTNDYLLVSKNNSELYIMPVGGTAKDEDAVKITDYYRVSFPYGYGKGY